MDLRFTFGIITDGSQNKRLETILDSIYRENILEFEVIIVGGTKFESKYYYKHVPFDESIKPKWITRKKNIITEEANYDTIVYMHDYVVLQEGWYEGWKKFFKNNTQKWNQIYMNQILNNDGTRFRDWTVWGENTPGFPDAVWKIPYNYTKATTYMVVFGTYWVARREVMLDNPLDEKLLWAQGEDVDWSKQVLPNPKYQYRCNPHSSVFLLKQKPCPSKIWEGELP